jgi:predicted RNA-binding protein with RPS1 domain/uncharacterized LabA/DUF88 family protein
VDQRREVALFVDLENIREGARQMFGAELPPAVLIEKARRYGLVNIARAYADFDRVPPETRREMEVCGITAVTAHAHAVDGHDRSTAALDLLMDLIETLLDRSGIPTVLLMSGDRDFLRVVTMARNRFGKEVVVCGVPGTVSPDLIAAAGGNYDPLEPVGGGAAAAPAPAPTVVAYEAAAPAAPAASAGNAANATTSAAPAYGRRIGNPPPAPRYEAAGGERPAGPARGERAETPGPGGRGERTRPQYGRRATRVTRGPQPETRPRLPQPDVEGELPPVDAEAVTPAWQRGKLAERAEAIQKMLAERRAAGEPVPAGALGLSAWQPGDVVEGTVKSITDFGAFLDLGGIDALLHVSQMAWQHVRHPSQVVQLGEKLRVQVLEVDETSNRMSVGLKQLTADPWLTAANKYEVGRLVSGRVSGVKEYGVFVELEPGIFGLLHISNVFPQPWGHHPRERYRLDQEVEVVVSKIDPDMRRLAFVLPGTPPAEGADEGVPGSAAGDPPRAAERGMEPPEAQPVMAGAHEDEEAAEAALRFREGAEEN